MSLDTGRKKSKEELAKSMFVLLWIYLKELYQLLNVYFMNCISCEKKGNFIKAK